jgi:hypothetical protein
MKKTVSRSKARSRGDDLAAEYRFDYSKAKPNRFAAQMGADTIAVVLAPDVATVFQSAEAVNAALRSVMAARPRQAKR